MYFQFGCANCKQITTTSSVACSFTCFDANIHNLFETQIKLTIFFLIIKVIVFLQCKKKNKNFLLWYKTRTARK